MPNGRFVSYCRVSTLRQGISGLGLDAQKKAINDYLNGGTWELLGEFVEVESGKNNERQELKKALHLCAMTGSTLVIAKLDRLSRNLHFVSSLQKAGIEFIACDMPQANQFTIHIIAAVAEHERMMISQRTKSALKIARERGVSLGTPTNLNIEAAEKGRLLGVAATKNKADEFALKVAPIFKEFQQAGYNLRQIAEELNNRNILTASGKMGCWCPSVVRGIAIRLKRQIPPTSI